MRNSPLVEPQTHSLTFNRRRRRNVQSHPVHEDSYGTSIWATAMMAGAASRGEGECAC